VKRLGVAAVVALGLLAAGCRGRPRSWDTPTSAGVDGKAAAGKTIELDLTLGAPEVGRASLLGLSPGYSFDALVGALARAEQSKNLAGVFVSFGMSGIGWARGRELGTALARLRDKGVLIVCHADAWDNASYAAAARGCTKIAVSPAGEVELTGPSSITPYARELLVDKLKADVDILQVGKFKGAAEPLTRDGPSEEHRQSVEATMAEIAGEYRRSVEARGVSALVGTGPYAGHEALDKKLVDVLADRNGARAIVTSAYAGPMKVAFGPDHEGSRPSLIELVRALSSSGSDGQSRPHVRLLRLSGEIALASEGGLLGGRAGIVARRVVERAHALTEDARVKAVVMRIDSPGGSALGSDLAWVALHELREKKPLIVSVGGMAASGGYYLSSAGSRIFAEPESIVGSIGVVGGKVSFGGTLAMAGVHSATFGDPRAASMGSLFAPWDEATRARMLASMTVIYDLFLDRIATGRGKPRASFENAVEGRIFGGARAKELGLVDELGGLGDALAAARKAADLPADAPVVVDEAGGLLDALEDDADEVRAPGAAALVATLGRTVEGRAVLAWLRSFVRATDVAEGGGFAAMMPTPIVVR
jgi:protease-4